MPHYLAAFLLLLTSCAVFKAAEAPEPSGFIPSSKVGDTPPALPFFKAWADPDFKPDNYPKVKVEEIDLTFIDKEEWQKSTGILISDKFDSLVAIKLAI